MGRHRARVALRWAITGVLIALLGTVFDALSLPVPVLLAGLVAGALLRLGGRLAPRPGLTAHHGAQAVVGAAAAIGVTTETVGAVAAHWAPVLLGCLLTLALSLAMGVALVRFTRLDGATGALSMVAGAASGIVSISHDLGADERVVAVLQYVRVVLTIALVPLIAVHLFDAGVVTGQGGATTWLTGAPFVAVSSAAGLLIARRVRVTGGELLWPMAVAIALALAGWEAAAAPAALLYVAYALIGLRAGSRMTVASLRRVGAALPAACALILVMIAICALFSDVLAGLTHVSELDAYLAMTPGGLPAVVAVAVDTGANVTFVVAMQVLRTIAMLALALPLIAWWCRRAQRTAAAPGGQGSAR